MHIMHACYRMRLAYCTEDERLCSLTCNRNEDVWLSILCELEHTSWSAILSLLDHVVTHKCMWYLASKLSVVLEITLLSWKCCTDVDHWLQCLPQMIIQLHDIHVILFTIANTPMPLIKYLKELRLVLCEHWQLSPPIRVHNGSHCWHQQLIWWDCSEEAAVHWPVTEHHWCAGIGDLHDHNNVIICCMSVHAIW